MGEYNLPSINKVDEVVWERIVVVGEPRRVTLHHLLQLLEDGAPARVREGAGRHLHQRDAERPHVRAHVVASRSAGVNALRLETSVYN